MISLLNLLITAQDIISKFLESDCGPGFTLTLSTLSSIIVRFVIIETSLLKFTVAIPLLEMDVNTASKGLTFPEGGIFGFLGLFLGLVKKEELEKFPLKSSDEIVSLFEDELEEVLLLVV